MKYISEYAKFNKHYYDSLKNIVNKSLKNPQGNDAEFLYYCDKKDIDFDKLLYKLLVDEDEYIEIDSKKYHLLPMGLINSCVHSSFINPEYYREGHYTLNQFNSMFLSEPKFIPFYYPNNCHSPKKENLNTLCQSYIRHYKETLDEKWSEEDFYKMFNELQFLSVKYAIDEETNELFAVGFFGASLRNGAGGSSLTNAELYVMPEFRGLGIAKKLVSLTFDVAHLNKIDNFDSITYRIPGNDALAFWQNVGAEVSGLIHIEGNIPDMLKHMEEKKKIL